MGWMPPSGGSGSGGVTSVTAGDSSLVISPTTGAVIAETGTLDVIATDHPPAAAVNMNGQKVTNQANGTAASDSAAYGQIPTSLPPSGSAGGDLTGTYPNPTIAKIAGQALSGTPTTGQGYALSAGGLLVPVNIVTTVGSQDASIIVDNFSTPNPTIQTATLDVVAATRPPAANWSNNSHKITSLANGTAASDAAAFGQIPLTLPGLAGTYWTAGRFYPPSPVIGSPLLITVSTAYAMPFIVGTIHTFVALAVDCTVAGTGGNLRMGIYSDNGSFYPGSLVVDGGTVAATSTGVLSVTISQALTPGLYWLVTVGQGGTTQPTLTTLPASSNGLGDIALNFGASAGSASQASQINGFTSASGFTGALPGTFTSGGSRVASLVFTTVEA